MDCELETELSRAESTNFVCCLFGTLSFSLIFGFGYLKSVKVTPAIFEKNSDRRHSIEVTLACMREHMLSIEPGGRCPGTCKIFHFFFTSDKKKPSARSPRIQTPFARTGTTETVWRTAGTL